MYLCVFFQQFQGGLDQLLEAVISGQDCFRYHHFINV